MENLVKRSGKINIALTVDPTVSFELKMVNGELLINMAKVNEDESYANQHEIEKFATIAKCRKTSSTPPYHAEPSSFATSSILESRNSFSPLLSEYKITKSSIPQPRKVFVVRTIGTRGPRGLIAHYEKYGKLFRLNRPKLDSIREKVFKALVLRFLGKKYKPVGSFGLKEFHRYSELDDYNHIFREKTYVKDSVLKDICRLELLTQFDQFAKNSVTREEWTQCQGTKKKPTVSDKRCVHVLSNKVPQYGVFSVVYDCNQDILEEVRCLFGIRYPDSSPDWINFLEGLKQMMILPYDMPVDHFQGIDKLMTGQYLNNDYHKHVKQTKKKPFEYKKSERTDRKLAVDDKVYEKSWHLQKQKLFPIYLKKYNLGLRF